MSSEIVRCTKLIKQEAIRLGFLSCGISKAEFLENEAPRLEHWLKSGYHGKMSYMERNFDMRLDPRLIVDDAASVISLTYNYYTDKTPNNTNTPKISTYAFGKDYHTVVKDKGYLLLNYIKELIGEVQGRIFVDSAPVLERAWAERSGLGWVGKHTNLISQQSGSYFFLAEIIIDASLTYDYATTDHCGTCTRCIDACPTQAIVAPYEVDSNRCISYLTIEYKEALPSHFSDKMNNLIFGCDICQEVCPWNRFSKPHNEPDFEPSLDLLQMTKNDWEGLTKETFDNLFKDSAVQRTGYLGLKRNIDFINNSDS